MFYDDCFYLLLVRCPPSMDQHQTHTSCTVFDALHSALIGFVRGEILHTVRRWKLYLDDCFYLLLVLCPLSSMYQHQTHNLFISGTLNSLLLLRWDDRIIERGLYWVATLVLVTEYCLV
jgi:hypothetical protein